MDDSWLTTELPLSLAPPDLSARPEGAGVRGAAAEVEPFAKCWARVAWGCLGPGPARPGLRQGPMLGAQRELRRAIWLPWYSIVRGLVRSADIFGAFLQIPLCGILVRETKVVLHWAIIVHSPGETAAVSCPY